MNHIIRSIEIQDLPQAFVLLEDLIRHENVGVGLKLTQEGMKQELFGPNADWHGLVAAHDKKIIGICLYCIANTSRPMNATPQIQIDDIYIHPDYRGHNIGRKFIQELSKIALKSNITRIELWCTKLNTSGQRFYQKLGAKKLDYIDVFRFDLDNQEALSKINSKDDKL